jgi:hypothetical protein
MISNADIQRKNMELKLATITHNQVRMVEIEEKGAHSHLIMINDLSSGGHTLSIKPKAEEHRGGECLP